MTAKSQKFIPVSTHIPISMEGAIPRLWKTKHQLKSLSSSLDLLLTSFVIYVLMPLCPAIYIPYLNKLLHKSVSIFFLQNATGLIMIATVGNKLPIFSTSGECTIHFDCGTYNTTCDRWQPIENHISSITMSKWSRHINSNFNLCRSSLYHRYYS